MNYLVADPSFPYCAGCGHKNINKALDAALEKLGKDPRQVNLVSDIGCVGLVDALFKTNTVHTTHGRSPAFATGIQLADELLFDGETTQIVMIGDGGATIGLLHLVEEARVNFDITVILHNNFLYGMTGGQSSGLTPLDMITSTALRGNVIPPLSIIEILQGAHAAYLARKHATDRDLADTLAEAIEYPGFALVEIIELCTGYARKWNKMSRGEVNHMLEGMEADKMGVIEKRDDRPHFGAAYRKKFPRKDAEHLVTSVSVKNSLALEKPLTMVLSGTAGEGVQFAARLCLQVGVANGLNVVQKNDNPVTVGSGFSFSELTFSDDEILYPVIDVPDYLIITSVDGYHRAKRFLSRASENTILIIDDSLPKPETEARVYRKPLRRSAKQKRQCNMIAIGCLLYLIPEVSMDLVEEAIARGGKNAERILESLHSGYDLMKDKREE